MRNRWLTSSLVTLVLAACGQGADPGFRPRSTDRIPDALNEHFSGARTTTVAARGVFGASCTRGEDCESGFCGAFEQLGSRCTVGCASDSECPAGARGAKCNRMGYCRP